MPPGIRPVPWTVNGSVPRPSSSTVAPSTRRASRTGPIGRTRAWTSPSKVTRPSASAATGGRKRITVPASPQSTWAPRSNVAGVTTQSGVSDAVRGGVLDAAPRSRRAWAIRSVSRDRSGRRSRDGPLASAARTRKRLVRDLLPGRATSASTGRVAAGADHPADSASDAACDGSGEGIVRLGCRQLGLAAGGVGRVAGPPAWRAWRCASRSHRQARRGRPAPACPRCRRWRAGGHRAGRGS